VGPNDTGTYITIVLIGTLLTLLVGQILIRSGRPIVSEVFEDEQTARSATSLIAVLFHLVALGLLGTISTFDLIEVEGTVQTMVTKIGQVLLVLGILYGLTLVLLNRYRSRRRSMAIENEVSAQYEQQRRARQTSRQQIIEGGNSSR